MNTTHYIILLIGVMSFGLAGCAGMPIAKTNCWSTAALYAPVVSQGTANPGTLASAEAVVNQSTCD